MGPTGLICGLSEEIGRNRGGVRVGALKWRASEWLKVFGTQPGQSKTASFIGCIREYTFVPHKCSGKRRQTCRKVLSLFFLLAEPRFRWSGEPIVLGARVCPQSRAERGAEAGTSVGIWGASAWSVGLVWPRAVDLGRDKGDLKCVVRPLHSTCDTADYWPN